ncbi:MAG: outer membrane beta-barrel protein [Taibaiella sp.]|nr:outer membrane beta-barrel protein [Taibaiella sp.]
MKNTSRFASGKVYLVAFMLFFPFGVYCQSDSNATQLKEVEITTVKLANTDVELINQIKKNPQIVSGISYEQISKGQDRDASEALQRVAGIALDEDKYGNKFAVIRGLNERYNTIYINGALAPSSESDKKSFAINLIPVIFLDQILVYKTPSAELPGDFTGGLVKIYTRTAPIGKSLLVNVNGFYRNGTTFQNAQFTQGSPTDILGYDNGFRSIPNGIPAKLESSSADITKLFKNTWVLQNKQATPDVRISACYSIGFRIGSVQLGSVTGVDYANLYTHYNVARNEYSGDVATVVPDNPSSIFNDIEYTNTVKSGLMQNFSVLINSKNKIEFKNFFNQSGRNESVLSTGIDDSVAHLKYFEFGYEQRTIYTSQLEYQFADDNNKNAYSCALGFSLNNRQDPDLRRINYQMPPDTFYRSNIPSGSGQLDFTDGATRFYSGLKEKNYSFDQHYKHTFKWDKFSLGITAGTYLEEKTRDFSARLFGYTLPVTYLRRSLQGLPVSEIFSDQNIDLIDTLQNKPAGFRIRETINTSNSYTSKNILIAPYASIDMQFRKVSLKIGLRVEDNDPSLNTNSFADTLKLNNHTRDYLPSFNLRYEVSGKSAIRLIYGKTLNRPEFREWLPYQYYDFQLLALASGTLYGTNGFVLKTAIIDNLDVRYELYPSPKEMITFGVFYKHFNDPIEMIIENLEHRTGISHQLTFQNSDRAYCYGAEFEIRKNLAPIDDLFNSTLFKNIDFIANGSLIYSRVTNRYSDSITKPRALVGQAPYLVNAALYYADKSKQNPFEVSLVYNIIGPRIYIAGGTDGHHTLPSPNIGEMPRHSIDITLKKNLNKHLSLNVGVEDLLNQSVKFVEDTNQTENLQKMIRWLKSIKEAATILLALS